MKDMYYSSHRRTPGETMWNKQRDVQKPGFIMACLLLFWNAF